MKKYLILDFGRVLAYPVSGEWFVTAKFFDYLDKDKLDLDKYLEKMETFYWDGILKDEKEEFEMFVPNIKESLLYAGYNAENIDMLAKNLAEDFVYNNDKYLLYEDTVEMLSKLKDEYTLICLTDNWPSGRRYMKEVKIYDMFDRVYVSSDYGYTKRDKILFDEPIKDYGIKENEAIFVDDSERLVRYAKEKGLIPVLMDRENKNSIYDGKVVKSLVELEKNAKIWYN